MRNTILLVSLLLLTACGGGGGGSDASPPANNTSPPNTSPPAADPPPPDPPPPDTPPPDTPPPDTPMTQPPASEPPDPVSPPAPEVTVAAANQFLKAGSFGPNTESMAALQSMGYEAWIDSQIAQPMSLHRQLFSTLPAAANNGQAQANRLDAFFTHALTADDQLRQRVAYALSQIMVVSDSGVLFNEAEGLADYYDVLVRQAFGNFRDLMQDVTLHPAMGVYLSMLRNEKPNTDLNIRPDENYARELMQLFTIGLVELNLDGTPVLAGGQPVPTYDQSIIEGFAHVYTGWTFAGSVRFDFSARNFTEPMEAFPEFHDTGEKRLLNGVVLPANQTPEADLAAALDNIFTHENVAPFISRQLIQRLVTANPTPAYVARVAAVFNDNGSGVKGDLAAVVKAILLDAEALGGGAGKLMEPLNRLIALWRAYDARAMNGRYIFPQPENFFGQAPLRAPSVFNFYRPDYAPTGEISDAGLVSPEMQITNETTVATTNDYLALAIYIQNTSNPDRRADAISIDFSRHLDEAADPELLMNRVALVLLGEPAPSALHDAGVAMISLIPADNASLRVAEAIYTIASSLEFATLGN